MWTKKKGEQPAVLSRDLEHLAAQVIKAVLDVESGLSGEEIGKLPPPPLGVCPKYLLLLERKYCGRKLLDGSDYCYWHARTKNKYSPDSIRNYFSEDFTLGQALAKEITDGQSLESAYLVDAPLGGNRFRPGCNIRNGKFHRANLSGAHLSYSDLEGADFSYANLERARLSDCRLNGARFVGSRLFEAKFRGNDFAGVIGLTMESFRSLKWGWLPVYRMLEEYPIQSVSMYRKLATHFSLEGLFDDASWAAYRACLMRHRLFSKRLSPGHIWANDFLDHAIYEKPTRLGFLSSRKFGLSWIVGVLTWSRSLLLKTVMGYGEKPLRVVANAVCAIGGYAAVYYLLGGINGNTFSDSLYFSMVTFTTLGYGDIAPHGPMRLIAASEALVGIFLSGLFIFCLGRRSVGRA